MCDASRDAVRMAADRALRVLVFPPGSLAAREAARRRVEQIVADAIRDAERGRSCRDS